MATRWLQRPDRRAHQEALADGLRAGCVAFALLFTVFAVWHAVEFEPAVARVMTPLALATAALAVAAYALVSRRRLPTDRAHLLAAGLATAALVNCVVQLALTGSDDLTLNVLLLVVGIGVCLVDPVWVAGLTVTFSAVWIAAEKLYGPSGWAVGGVADLIIAVAVAAMANVLRRRTLARLLLAQEELRVLSERDELTGLLNRRGFLDAALRRMTAGRPVTLWFIDVDDLKQVNDQHGHDVGDLLLLCVATALEEVFSDAVVARLSGDEFAVVEQEASLAAQADRLALLEQRLALPTAATGLPVRVSTGTATSSPGQELSEVLGAADAAMYRAKAARRRRRPSPEPHVVVS